MVTCRVSNAQLIACLFIVCIQMIITLIVYENNSILDTNILTLDEWQPITINKTNKFYIHSSQYLDEWTNGNIPSQLSDCVNSSTQHRPDNYFISQLKSHPNRVFDPSLASKFIVPIMFDCLSHHQMLSNWGTKLTILNQTMSAHQVLDASLRELAKSESYLNYHPNNTDFEHYAMFHNCDRGRVIKNRNIMLGHDDLRKSLSWIVYEGGAKGSVAPYIAGVYKQIEQIALEQNMNLYDYEQWKQRNISMFGSFSIVWQGGVRIQALLLNESQYYTTSDVGFYYLRVDKVARNWIYQKYNGTFNISAKMNKTEYAQKMVSAKFCLNMKGDTCTSNRLYESVTAGCIPIIVGCYDVYASNDTKKREKVLPFPQIVPYDSFVIFMKDLKNISLFDEIISDLIINETKTKAMLQNMQKYSKYLLWHRNDSKTAESVINSLK